LRTVSRGHRHGDGHGTSSRPDSPTMKYLFCTPDIWRFQMARQHRFLNSYRPDAIVKQEFSAVFYGLPPSFRVFFPTLKTTLAVLSASLPTRLQLFWRTTRIVLINDALLGNGAGVSGPRPIFIPNQTISISKGTGFGPGHIIVPQQRHNPLKRQGKIYLANILFSKNVFGHDAPDKVLPPGDTGKKCFWISNIEFVYVKL